MCESQKSKHLRRKLIWRALLNPLGLTRELLGLEGKKIRCLLVTYLRSNPNLRQQFGCEWLTWEFSQRSSSSKCGKSSNELSSNGCLQSTQQNLYHDSPTRRKGISFLSNVTLISHPTLHEPLSLNPDFLSLLLCPLPESPLSAAKNVLSYNYLQ